MQPRPPARPTWPATLLAVGTVLVGMWIVAATAVLQGVMWLAGEAVLASTGHPAPIGAYLVTAWLQAFLVAAPAGLLVVLARAFAPDALAVRASARAWLLAGAAAGVLGTAR